MVVARQRMLEPTDDGRVGILPDDLRDIGAVSRDDRDRRVARLLEVERHVTAVAGWESAAHGVAKLHWRAGLNIAAKQRMRQAATEKEQRAPAVAVRPAAVVEHDLRGGYVTV